MAKKVGQSSSAQTQQSPSERRRDLKQAAAKLDVAARFTASGLSVDAFLATGVESDSGLRLSPQALRLWAHIYRDTPTVEAFVRETLRETEKLLRLDAIARIIPGHPRHIPELSADALLELLVKEAHPIQPSVEQLYALRKAYLNGGVSALRDCERGGKGKPRGWLAVPANQDKVLVTYRKLSAHNKRVKSSVLRAALVAKEGAARGREIPTPRTLEAFIEAHRDPGVDAFMFGGEKAYAAHAYLKPKSDFGMHGEVLIIDHKQSDIRALDGERPVRPWYTTAVDPKSGACRAFIVSPYEPGSTEIALALREAILDKPWDPERLLSGVPRILYMDRGRDMRSAHIESALADLKVERVLAMAHMPWKRGSIEGNLHRCVSLFEERGIPGFIGHKTSERPADAKPQLQVIAVGELVRHYVFQEFNHTLYQRKKALPDGTMAKVSRLDLARAFRAPIREVGEDALLLALMKRELRTVQDTGIVIAPFTYISETTAFFELAQRRAQVEVRWDPSDLSKVWVCDGGRLVCIANNTTPGGQHATERTVKRYHELNARARKGVREQYSEERQAAQNGSLLDIIAEQEVESQAVAAAGGGKGPSAVRQLLPHEKAIRNITAGPSVVRRPTGKPPKPPRESPLRLIQDYDPFSRNVLEDMCK